MDTTTAIATIEGAPQSSELPALEQRPRGTRSATRIGVWSMQAAAVLLVIALMIALTTVAFLYFRAGGNPFNDWRGALADLVGPAVEAIVVFLVPCFFLQWAVVNLWRERARHVNYFACFLAGGGGLYCVGAYGVGAFSAGRDPWVILSHVGLAGLGLFLIMAAFGGGVATGLLENQTRATWAERFVNVVLLAIAATLVWLTATRLSYWQSITLWTIYLTALFVATYLGHLKLLGPVLFYDMLRTGRQNRYFILRMLYAGFLFFILSYMVLIAYVMGNQFGARQNAVIAETFFMFFMLVQLAIVVLLTPAYVAGAVADEKDRKTMEFILATDLRDREIIFSKLLARLGNMSLLLITGLPILSILQFIGGVDPDLMLAGFAAIALTMLGIGSLSILLSTLFKRPRDAISLTYLIMIAYAALATAAFVLQMSGFWVMSLPVWFGPNAWSIGDCLGMLNAGNPLTVIWRLTIAVGGRGAGGNLAGVLPGLLEGYAWFYLTFAAICITWSIFRVRPIALIQTTAGTTATVRWWQKLRPAVSNAPMLWKEIFIEGRTKLNWLIWCAVAVLVLLTLGSGLWIVGWHIYEFFDDGIVPRGRPFGRGNLWESLNDSMNVWWRITGTFVGTLLVLMAGVRASTTVTSERERNTFDALVTTPLSAEAMLFAKLVGNLLGMRVGWFWLGSMLLLAFVTGGIHPYGVPIVVGGCLVYSTFMTMVGMAYSTMCRSSLHSAVFTVLTAIVLGGGHWLITSCFCMPAFGALFAVLELRFNIPRDMQRVFEEAGLYVIKFQAGLTPPFVYPWCSFSWRQIDDDFRLDRHFWEFVGSCVLGIFIWWLASVALWFFLLVPKFRRIMRRVELENA